MTIGEARIRHIQALADRDDGKSVKNTDVVVIKTDEKFDDLEPIKDIS